MTTSPIVIPVRAHEMVLETSARRFYQDVVARLRAARVRFLVGGAFALKEYAGISRNTKDLDLVIKPESFPAVERALVAAGYDVELTFTHWLGKVRHDHHFVDVMFNSGNGLTEIDDGWFEHARPTRLFGHEVELVPPEELLFSKCFVMERERYDGADVAHLLRSCAGTMDWPRLLARFGDRWRVLFSHLVMFGFIYPGERHNIPAWVIERLSLAMIDETDPTSKLDLRCQGTLVSRAQYIVDVQHWGYEDARLGTSGGGMTEQQIHAWTDAINKID